MCLYPRLVRNPKYMPNKKNGGQVPPVYDTRVLYVPVGCNKCMECRKQKAQGWKLRLMEEIKDRKDGKFVTLTFSNEAIIELLRQRPTKQWPSLKGLEGFRLDNEIAKRAVHLWRENWRKEFKISPRHWLITELGHNGTENIHLHGIVWTDRSYADIRRKWKYGHIWPRNEKDEKKTYINARTINYMVKYVTKVEEKYKEYVAIILTSPGIGKGWTDEKKNDWKDRKFNGKETREYYRTDTGHKVAMPIYWKNKVYSEEEREQLWLQRLDKEERWICGERVDIKNGEEGYYKLLKWYRKKNDEIGYGNDKVDWKREAYEQWRRNMMTQKRTGTEKSNLFSKIERIADRMKEMEEKQYEDKRLEEFNKIYEEIIRMGQAPSSEE